MTDRARIRLLTGALAVALLPALPGCVEPYHDAPPPPRFPPYYYDYYYYPHVDVYFHIYSGHYWYRDGPYWRRVRRLPPHIHLHPRYRVVLRVYDEYPHRRYDEHRKEYPPPQPRPQPGPPPQGRPQPGPPQPPPSGRLHEEFDWQERDREERRYNTRQYEEYRRKPWIAPK